MMKEYTLENKQEAVKLAKEIGVIKASIELGVPKGTLYGWIVKENNGEIDLGSGSRTISDALSLAAEMKILRDENKAYEKENARLNKINAFLEEASRFFAAGRLASKKNSVLHS